MEEAGSLAKVSLLEVSSSVAEVGRLLRSEGRDLAIKAGSQSCHQSRCYQGGFGTVAVETSSGLDISVISF